jgi:hypothetical protein
MRRSRGVPQGVGVAGQHPTTHRVHCSHEKSSAPVSRNRRTVRTRRAGNPKGRLERNDERRSSKAHRQGQASDAAKKRPQRIRPVRTDAGAVNPVQHQPGAAVATARARIKFARSSRQRTNGWLCATIFEPVAAWLPVPPPARRNPFPRRHRRGRSGDECCHKPTPRPRLAASAID